MVIRNRYIYALAILIALSCVLFINLAMGQQKPKTDSLLISKGPGTLVCWSETLTSPRPLAIYFLKFSVNDPELELVVLPSLDPDSAGPAEGKLTKPTELFLANKAFAAVNANAFEGTPDSEKLGSGWYEGRAVDMKGLVVAGGKVKSPDEPKRLAFWLDKKGIPHIGHPKETGDVQQAVADWIKPILSNGAVLPDSTDKVLHPRTLIGFSMKQNFILFAVVDGRQKGYSEGMAMRELALLMKSKGCDNAINLDGGGSSVMLLSQADGHIKTINKPSGKVQRPVPVMIGVRKK
jgi:exopolysaccharide biosynthesis protein